MNDESALLNVIVAHPDEDTPRLMYADWLQENGQPERAEFIRLQIESARPSIDASRRGVIVRRIAELLGKYRKAWTKPLRDLLSGARLDFCRGFVEEIEVEAPVYARAAKELFLRAPIRNVLLKNCSAVCGANEIARPRRTCVRVLANPGLWGAQRRTLTLLAPAPEHLEADLTTDEWLVLAWAVWSGSDRRTARQLSNTLRSNRLNGTLQFAMRPFDEHREFQSWCPNVPEFSNPLWLQFAEGKMVSHHVGLAPPSPLREMWG